MNVLFISEIKMKRDHISTGYPFSLPAIKHLNAIKLDKPVTFFVGENGTGKSTLLEAIAVNFGFNPEGGSRNFNFETHASHSCLHEYLLLVKGVVQPKDGFFLRAETFYNVATQVDQLELNLAGYGGKSLHHQSHGESFLALIQHRFRGKGLYILDEPEAALSPMRLLSMICVIDELAKNGSQFIIATHSPIIMAYPSSSIYSFSPSGIEMLQYEQTEHYQVTKSFINNYKGMLKHLLDDDDDDDETE